MTLELRGWQGMSTPDKLAAILDHPRVKELRPEWYSRSTYMGMPVIVVFDRPDLLSIGGLGHLLALADEVGVQPIYMAWNADEAGDVHWGKFDIEIVLSPRPMFRAIIAHGPTRTEAVINALYAALGGKE